MLSVVYFTIYTPIKNKFGMEVYFIPKKENSEWF